MFQKPTHEFSFAKVDGFLFNVISAKMEGNKILKSQDTGGLISGWTVNKKLIKSILLNGNVSVTRISEISDSLVDWYDRNNLRQ